MITTVPGTSSADEFLNAKSGSLFHKILENNIDIKTSFRGLKQFDDYISSGSSDKIAFYFIETTTLLTLSEENQCKVSNNTICVVAFLLCENANSVVRLKKLGEQFPAKTRLVLQLPLDQS